MAVKDELRCKRNKAVLNIRAIVLEASRSWFKKQGFVEVQGPVLLPAVGKRPYGFQVNYFDKNAFLSGGLQPYSDVLVEMLKKVYTVAPTFRAEPLRDKRHLTEFWRVEVAASGLDLNGIIQMEEELVAYVCRALCQDAVDELGSLRGSISCLERMRTPFPSITYDDAVELLQEAGCNINWGEPLSWPLEHKLSTMFDAPFFVSEFPVSGETFFHKSHVEKPELSLCADLLSPEGYGEIASGGEALSDRKVLLEKLKEMKIDASDRRWYLSLRRFDSIPQSGFALGIERFLQWVCKLKDISEAIAFPRTYDHIYP